jgi:SAM-dependent methyltransferase
VDPYLAANRANWDDRVPIHVASRFYDIPGWLDTRPGPRTWERPYLGDLTGRQVVHLQCHIGLDTLALADAGATVTGLDFSPQAIDTARELQARAGIEAATFVEADVLHAAEVLPNRAFDLVYVSLGALCWLPQVDRWAEQVHALLKPGGRLFLHDSHPVSWSLADDDLRFEHTYFEETDPHRDDCGVTYTDGDRRLAHERSYEWNHSIGEIVTAVLRRRLRIDSLEEHDWTVWPRFSWLEPTGDGRWGPLPGTPRPPLTFTLTATQT